VTSEPHLQAVPGGSWTAEPPPPTGGGSGDSPPPGAAGKDRATSKQRPERSLPTDRMKFDKQVEALHLYAQLSGPSHGPVSAEDLANTMDMSPSTTALCSGFFRDSNWLTRVGRGSYAATDGLLEYNRHLNVDPSDRAGALPYLADLARDSWYWAAIEPLLRQGSARRSVLLLSLSKAAGAHNHKAQLLLLLEWLDWLELIDRDGDLVRLGTLAGREDGLSTTTDDVDGPHLEPGSQGHDVDDMLVTSEIAVRPVKETAPGVVDDALGSLIAFNFSVRITADDAAKLTPEQITALLQVVDKLRG
jgi:hypothetical protein